MKTTITLDLRSLFLGLIAGIGFVLLMGSQRPAETDQGIGRYQVATSENAFIIVNTQTGKFIMNTSFTPNSLPQEDKLDSWLKEDFTDAYSGAIGR